MNKMPGNFLLYPVFNELRRHGVPLGVSEYLDVVKAVRAGIMVEDLSQFKRLCRLLWTKSPEDQELFEVAFARFVEPRLQSITKPQAFKSLQTPEAPLFDEQSSTMPVSVDSSPDESPSVPETRSPIPFRLEEKVVRAASLDILDPQETEISGRPYQLTPRYPMDPREIATSWRHLRKLQRAGPPEELDIKATIRDICSTGVFSHPVLRPRHRNQARVVLLIDRDGSMVPFTPLVEVLVSSIQRGGLLGRVSCLYFHDCPEAFLYTQPTLMDAHPFERILEEQIRGNSVLIVSDAGAARGSYDAQRLQATQAFLKTLNLYTYRYAWLNPVPSVRWMPGMETPETTAKNIARCAPMFPITHNGLNDIVNVLRGQPFPVGVNLDGC